jgi:hypothetical protein
MSSISRWDDDALDLNRFQLAERRIPLDRILRHKRAPLRDRVKDL